jgi:hypothetical protein
MRAVNLIPGDQRSGGSVGVGRSGGAAYAVLALLVGFAVLAFMYGKASRAVSSDESKAATLSAEAAHDKAAAEQLAPYTSFVALRKARETAVHELVNTRFDWAHTFHEFGRVLTHQVSVSSLDGQIGEQAKTTSSSSATPATSSVSSATPAGSVPVFTLSGCATSQKTVAQTLQRLRLIDGVSEVTLQSSTKGGSNTAGATGGGCPAGFPVFTATVTFEPLPTASQAAAAANAQTDVANKTATPAPTPSTTNTGGGAR